MGSDSVVECQYHFCESVGNFIRALRCAHIGEEWIVDQLEAADRDGYCDGKEHLARYAKAWNPKWQIYSYFNLDDCRWEEAEEALLAGNIFNYGYQQLVRRRKEQHDH